MSDMIGKLMFEDITCQPKTLEAVIEGFYNQVDISDRLHLHSWLNGGILFTGCGTTYALGLSVAAFFRMQGISSTAVPASEINFFPETIPKEISTLVAFSRSGETSETLWAVNAFRKNRPGGKVIVITTKPISSLAHLANLVLSEISAKDNSIIETRSFTAMLLIGQLFSEWVVDNQLRLDLLKRLPEHMQRLMPKLKHVAERVGRDLSVTRFFFLGSGAMYGIAYQAALTMKECTAEWAEAFHTLEFRHGPRTAANNNAYVCLFVSDSLILAREELRVLKDMKDQGAQIQAIFDKNINSDPLLLRELEVLELESGLSDSQRIVLYLPFVQWLAYFRALANNQDPDRPTNLFAVTKL